MNLGLIARLLSGFVLFFTASIVVPLAVSFGDAAEHATPGAFGGAIGVGLGLAGVLWFAGRRSKEHDVFRREGLAMVGLAWLVAGALAAIPFVWSGAIPSFTDAYFESISGLTTTGATVLGTGNVNIESLPVSLLLWRSMLQWMGGIGIVLVFIVLLPGVGVTGSRLLSSEQVGVSTDVVRPRMALQARRLFGLYAGLTVLAALAYFAVGLGAFDAICHALTTMATGGFSTNDVSLGGYKNLGVEIVAVVFMFVASCNFLLMLRLVLAPRGGGGGKTAAAAAVGDLHRRELLAYVGFIAVVAVGITWSLWSWGQALQDESLGTVHEYGNLGRCVRDAVFQTVSIVTSTGYANADFETWPKPALYLIFVCMCVGGCTGSTAGGFKMLRVVICWQIAARALRHFVRPRTVHKLRVGTEVIPDRVVTAVLGLLLLWIASVAVGTFVLDLDPRLDLMSALTASVSMMGCVGPAFGEVLPAGDGVYEIVGSIDLGPYSGYGELHPATKLFMSLQMVLGRLEVLAPLALLTPGFWRR